ncbi:ribosome production factor [Anaeramoeba flamelloides]|uniref:Ribosome production factor n=1 Tax=Anaeramoeba flamelloides TaxID=1746091 RepID=A0AAV7ZGL7_9EUKA|nr:ribosome production factor [Anaeramoeba flamelloides]
MSKNNNNTYRKRKNWTKKNQKKEEEVELPPKQFIEHTLIKNKQRNILLNFFINLFDYNSLSHLIRSNYFQVVKEEKKKQKILRRKKRQKEREELGEKAPPKLVQITQEMTRLPDLTTVVPNDPEVLFSEKTDEMSEYFDKKKKPKICFTTTGNTKVHVPKKFVQYRPELIFKNFSTRLGHTVTRMLNSLMPHNPQYKGRRLLVFHNQRDFVFFRHYRYKFESKEKTSLSEIGPQFTLKLRTVQLGTWDTNHGEYIWYYRSKMGSSRLKWFL